MTPKQRFDTAIQNLRGVLKDFPEEDRKDMVELLPFLFHRDEEERIAVERAVEEIFNPPQGQMQRMV